MVDGKGKFTHLASWAKALLFGGLALAVTATPAPAQKTIGGHFTLNESARFGNNLLAAGPYRFSIETVGNLPSIGSIQDGLSTLVQVVLRSQTTGAQASVLAMASGDKHQGDSNELTLEPGTDAAFAKTLYMEKEGLLVNFRWATPKPKGSTAARATTPERTAVAMQASASR